MKLYKVICTVEPDEVAPDGRVVLVCCSAEEALVYQQFAEYTCGCPAYVIQQGSS